jgi:hypothetical protein
VAPDPDHRQINLVSGVAVTMDGHGEKILDRDCAHVSNARMWGYDLGRREETTTE